MKRAVILTLTGVVAATAVSADEQNNETEGPFIVVLGTAQDAGFPQAGCNRDCCREVWDQPNRRRYVTSLAVVDPVTDQRWLFDCTPDFREQLRLLDQLTRPRSVGERLSRPPSLDAVFLTHAHIGHYAGLIHLGREVIGADAVPVFAMPRMSQFLRNNGPWSQLVSLHNIDLQPLSADISVRLNKRLKVTPFVVPHRDEFSETVGFLIVGPTKKAVFIPDIDKWEKWERSIEDIIRNVDVAWLDGTFFEDREIPGRDMSQIPHPFIPESLQRFSSLPRDVRDRVRFIHMNHTNPALRVDSAARRMIEETGCHVAEQRERFGI